MVRPAGGDEAERAAKPGVGRGLPTHYGASEKVSCRLMMPTAVFSSADMNFVAMYLKM